MLTIAPSDYFQIHTWVFLVSLVTALLEIQIEGPHGWAKNLPTWRFGPSWLKTLLNGKEITGYHLYFILLLLALFHGSSAEFVGKYTQENGAAVHLAEACAAGFARKLRWIF